MQDALALVKVHACQVHDVNAAEVVTQHEHITADGNAAIVSLHVADLLDFINREPRLANFLRRQLVPDERVIGRHGETATLCEIEQYHDKNEFVAAGVCRVATFNHELVEPCECEVVDAFKERVFVKERRNAAVVPSISFACAIGDVCHLHIFLIDFLDCFVPVEIGVRD